MTTRTGRWTAAAYLLALTLASLVVTQSGAAESTEAISIHPAELQQRLDAALAAKGSDYVPRTEHLHPDGRARFTNRLILENSPYLLQHAHNPVEWYPWGPEAFEQARRENKLVFLSIGYSTCHWCHVMERESFEDLAIAKLLNEHFIAIKVDREIHPDVDQTYMTAVELLAGRGGWPMSSILTPDGDTIDGGTYFPPAEFTRLLERARDLWQARPDALRAQAEQVARAVSRALDTQGQAAALDDAIIDQAVAELLARHDELQGGFGHAPKFPQEPKLALLLDQALRSGHDAALNAAIVTLRSMAHGGIHDQVGGGFHRYAIDNGWLVPHFEKMLYNQAQLARVYLAGWRLTADPDLARVTRRTLDYVLRDMASPEGGFYSATDADSEGEEGRFFLWTPAELRGALPAEDAELASRFHGVTETGNFEGRNILHVPVALDAFAAAQGVAPADLKQRLAQIHARLYQVREERPHPHRDEKILTAWNGMMISALAEAGAVLKEPRYLAAAERAADLLWAKARPAPGQLTRVYLHGRASQPALLEDYAFLGAGLIALYDASADPRWLERARELADAFWSRFSDPAGGGLFMGEASTDTPLMARPKDLSDGAMPSGTSAALHLLAALDQRTDDLSYGQRARELLSAASGRARRTPSAYPSLLTALNRLRQGDTGPRQYAARGAVRLRGEVVRADDSATLRLMLDMAPGWHINAHEPLQQALIATQLRLPKGNQAWRIEDLTYPPAQIRRLGFQREALAVYEGKAQIAATLSTVSESPSNDAGQPSAWLPMELRLQACSDERCLPPETRVLQIPIAIDP